MGKGLNYIIKWDSLSTTLSEATLRLRNIHNTQQAAEPSRSTSLKSKKASYLHFSIVTFSHFHIVTLFNSFIITLLLIATSCQNTITLSEAKQQINNPENGLTQSHQGPHHSYMISLFPPNYVQALNGDSKQLDLAYFQLQTNQPDFLFKASEQNFEWTVNEISLPASIVIAENRGSLENSKLMIGFPAQAFTGDGQLTIKDYQQKVLAQFHFSQSDFNRIRKLNIQ